MKKLRNGGGKYGGFSLALLVLLIASLIALNVGATLLEKRNGWRLDWSFNGITTQSAETKEILAALDNPVHIYALFRRGEEDAQLMELLDRYAAGSPYITWEQVDPSLNPALLTRFATDTETVSADSLIVYGEKTGRFRILGPADYVSLSMDTETGEYSYAGWTYEESITGAIQYVTRERIPRVRIVQGHGELDGDTLEAFDTLLTGNQYEVEYISLSDTELDSADLLAFFSPLRDLTEEELEAVRAFADAGGSLLFTCDYTDPLEQMPNWTALLRSYGFLPKEGVVVVDKDQRATYYNNTRIYLIPTLCATDATLDLLSSGASSLLLPGARGFALAEEGDRNLLVSDVLESGEGSYRKVLSAETTSMDRAEGDEEGPFALALQARRITASGSISRAFVIGCSATMTEESIWVMTDGRQFVLSMVGFLLDTHAGSVTLTPKDALRPALGVGSTTLGAVILVALPLAVLAIALIVLIPRRNR